MACIIKSDPSKPAENYKDEVTKEIKTFGTFPDDLAQLKAWLEAEDCLHVAMESTGVYWQPIYEALESAHGGEIDIKVVNARHMKNVPGKKTDIKDSEWIARLLLGAAFRQLHPAAGRPGVEAAYPLPQKHRTGCQHPEKPYRKNTPAGGVQTFRFPDRYLRRFRKELDPRAH